MALGSVRHRSEGSSPAPTGATDASPVVALNAFLLAMARHRLAFGAVVVCCLLGGGLWLAQRTPTYESSAAILVSPIPAGDESLVGLPVIRASDLDPQRAAETAAPLLQSSAAARRAAAQSGVGSEASVAASVEVRVLEGASLVEVIAEGASPAEAASVANAYAEAALRVRDRHLAPQIEAAIANTENQLARVGGPAGREASLLEKRLATLRSIAGEGDPTLSLARPAASGVSQDTPAPQVISIAFVAGLLLAGLTVVMIELLVANPISSEAELERLYRLPVLGRVSQAAKPGATASRAAAGDGRPGAREGFRSLRDQLELRAADAAAHSPDRGSVVLMVSPGRGDQRAGGSLELARAFAVVHGEVTLVELDARRPRLAAMLGVEPAGDISELLSGVPIESVATPFDSGSGRLVPAPPAADLATREGICARTGEILEQARRLADWTVADAPPAAESPADVIAALGASDHVVVVVHLGSTRPESVAALRELLEQRECVPDGYLVVSEALRRGRRPGSLA